MLVNVKSGFPLRKCKQTDDGKIALNLPPNSTVRQVLKSLNINAAHIGMLVLNSKMATLDPILEDNDELEIYPFIDGG